MKPSLPTHVSDAERAQANLEQLVADVDRGGRNLGGLAGAVLFTGAILWSLFQLWYASPLPFALNFGILNDTEARALHLGVAMFLGYLAYPARARSPRDSMPLHDWLLAGLAGFCGSYLFSSTTNWLPGQVCRPHSISPSLPRVSCCSLK